MKNPLSKKIVQVQPSGIRKFFDLANEMDDVISLGVGEPDLSALLTVKIRRTATGFLTA
jgi:aspartate/methionine/tyrosine aminotransferase